VTARARNLRSRIVKGLVATVAVCSMLSVAIAAPADAKSKPKSLKKVDLHALVACTGLDVSASGVYYVGQPPDPNVMFNVVTGLTRSKTKGARKQLATLQATTGEAQYPAINNALTWCTDHGYTRRSS
jgi:hypothetical protein